jgi:hypothetical protein
MLVEPVAKRKIRFCSLHPPPPCNDGGLRSLAIPVIDFDNIQSQE